jgi:glycosyltransferase involved in cell wall biosynthesis
MKVSVVVPAHNAEPFLERTLESVLAQTFGDWELVIVDDGSSDGTVAIAEAYVKRARRLHVVRQTNAGTAAARNRGLAETSLASQYIAFLDHDDVWQRDTLEVLLDALDAHPEAVAVNGLSRIVDDRGEPCEPGELEMWGRRRRGVVGKRLAAWPVHAPTTLAVLAYRNCIYTPGQVLIRRTALEAVGPFDPSASPCDDWDMWLRLSQHGPIAFVDRVVLSWRKHANNAGRQSELMVEKMAYVRRKLLAAPQFSKDERRVALVANWLWGRALFSERVRRAKELLAQGYLRKGTLQLCDAVTCYVQCATGVPVVDLLFYPTLKELYRDARNTPSDIREHLETLRRLAACCDHVTEFGTRWGTSTIAFLNGQPKGLVCYDRERLRVIDILQRAARDTGRTHFVFCQADVLDVQIEETDLLFIDTRHVYEQLKQQLAVHANKVRKYLVFHHTTAYGESGETPGYRGLWPAIEEFLQENPHWALAARLTHNNGLTILERLTGRPCSGRIPLRLGLCGRKGRDRAVARNIVSLDQPARGAIGLPRSRRNHRTESVLLARSCAMLAVSCAGILLLWPSWFRLPFLPHALPEHRLSSPPRSLTSAEVLREAGWWRMRAKITVSRELEAHDAADPGVIDGIDDEAFRRHLLAADRDGALHRARELALQGASLARTPLQECRAAELLALLECESGHHASELEYAKRLVALKPRSERSLIVLRRAAGCNGRVWLQQWAAERLRPLEQALEDQEFGSDDVGVWKLDELASHRSDHW